MRLPVKIILLAAVLAAAGCSEGGDGSWPPIGLVGALDTVRATDETRAYVEYSNGARLAELIAEDRDRFLSLTGIGLGNVAAYSRQVEDALGVDLTTMGTAIQVGQPPDWAGAVRGSYDADALNARLGELDISRSESDGATYWRAADDHEIDLDDGPFAGVVPTSEFNNIRVAEGSFAFSPMRAGLDWFTGGDRSLADDPRIAEHAECLGAAVVAIIVDDYSIGVRADTASDVTEVLCLANRDPAAVEERLADGSTAATREPWSEVLPDAKVEKAGGLVRITARSPEGRPAGRVVALLYNRELDGL